MHGPAFPEGKGVARLCRGFFGSCSAARADGKEGASAFADHNAGPGRGPRRRLCRCHRRQLQREHRTMFIQLEPFGIRPPIQEVMQRLRPEVARVIGVKYYMQAGQDVTIGARLEQAQYQYTLTDTDADELNHWAPILLAKMRGLKILTDVASDQLIASPEITADIDRQAASSLGVTPSAVDAALYAAFGQEQIATIYTSTQQPKLILEVQPKFQTGPADLSKIFVSSSSGGQVPLSAFARYTNKTVPLTVNHQGVFPSVTLSFNLAPGVALSQAVAAISALQSQLHVDASVGARWGGPALGSPARARPPDQHVFVPPRTPTGEKELPEVREGRSRQPWPRPEGGPMTFRQARWEEPDMGPRPPPAWPTPSPRSPASPSGFDAEAGAVARALRARGGPPLHPALPDELRDRHLCVSAGIVHHEVQPEGLRGDRPAEDRRGAPPGAARRRPCKGRSRSSGGSRGPCRRSRGSPRSRSSRPRARTASSPRPDDPGVLRGPR